MSCIRGMTVRSRVKSLSQESGMGSACVVFNIQSKMASHTSADLKCPFM